MKELILSVLDLAPIVQGGTAAQALRNCVDVAQLAERRGYSRYWLAEHHNMTGIASSATAIAIAHVAEHTRSIRVGSGGVMLPNHAPLIVAEQFGTLEALFPGRIDLGLGRAPGTDAMTARALRRNIGNSDETFPRDVVELQAYFAPAMPSQAVRAVPGAGCDIPIWLLGSSLFSAQLAAALGLRFAFASHFAPDFLLQALAIYRREFRPSATLREPYAMAGINVIAAESEAEARRLFTSHQQAFINLRRGEPGPLPPPVDSMRDVWTPHEAQMIEHALRYTIVGTRETVARRLAEFVEMTGVDEVMAAGQIFDHNARLRSFEILADARDSVGARLGVAK